MRETTDYETRTCICGRAIRRDAEAWHRWLHDDNGELECNLPGYGRTCATPSTPKEREHWALLIRKGLV